MVCKANCHGAVTKRKMQVVEESSSKDDDDSCDTSFPVAISRN